MPGRAFARWSKLNPSGPIVQERAGFLQIGSFEAFGEPREDWSENRRGLRLAVLGYAQPRETR